MLDKFISNVSATDLPFELFKLRNKNKIIVNGKVYNFKDEVNSFVKNIIEKESITEIDYSDAFGFEETKDMDGKKTFNYLKKNMGMNDEDEYCDKMDSILDELEEEYPQIFK
jgi:thiol-disulfide isomerase/thioredoxin